LNASLLLYVVDASDPSFRSQLEVVEDVLLEVGVRKTPVQLVLNKSDLLDDLSRKRLQREFPDSILISAQKKEDIQALRERILNFFERDMVDAEIFVPYSADGIIGEIRTNMRVLEEKHENEGTRFTVRTRRNFTSFKDSNAKGVEFTLKPRELK
jgi:GTPase